MDKNRLNLAFRILGDRNIDEHVIAKSLQLSPDIIIKGGRYINEEKRMVAICDGLVFVSLVDESDSFQTQMDYFLQILEPKISILGTFNCVLEFLCVVTLINREEASPWIHLDERANSFLADTGAIFNLKICFSSESQELAYYHGCYEER